MFNLHVRKTEKQTKRKKMTKSNKEADTRAHHWPCAHGLAASADDRVIRDQSRPMGLTGSGRLLTYLSVKLTRSEKNSDDSRAT